MPYRTLVTVALLTTSIACARVEAGPSVTLPAPVVDEARAPKSDQKMAVFAGGCFWGIEAVFEHVKGVVLATSGYAGGDEGSAHYEMVGTGATGHAESVQVIYDPSIVTYGELLQIFFSVAHDPTQLNRQGPDDGPQYRSALFTTNPDQDRIARAYIAQLNATSAFRAPIVTTVSPLEGFYAAEDEHQDFARRNPDNPYIRVHDAPKVEALRTTFPERYRSR